MQGSVEARDRTDQLRQCSPLRFFGKLPVAHPFQLLVGDVRGELGHGVQANVAAMSQHRGQLQADAVRFAVRSLVRRKEVVREAQVVVDLDQ